MRDVCEFCVLCEVAELWDPLSDVDWEEPDVLMVDGCSELPCEVEGLVAALCASEVVVPCDLDSDVDGDLSKWYVSDLAWLWNPPPEVDLDVAPLKVFDVSWFWDLSGKVDCDVAELRVCDVAWFWVLFGNFVVTDEVAPGL